jgi:hypothetical protein
MLQNFTLSFSSYLSFLFLFFVTTGGHSRLLRELLKICLHPSTPIHHIQVCYTAQKKPSIVAFMDHI